MCPAHTPAPAHTPSHPLTSLAYPKATGRSVDRYAVRSRPTNRSSLLLWLHGHRSSSNVLSLPILCAAACLLSLYRSLHQPVGSLYQSLCFERCRLARTDTLPALARRVRTSMPLLCDMMPSATRPCATRRVAPRAEGLGSTALPAVPGRTLLPRCLLVAVTAEAHRQDWLRAES